MVRLLAKQNGAAFAGVCEHTLNKVRYGVVVSLYFARHVIDAFFIPSDCVRTCWTSLAGQSEKGVGGDVDLVEMSITA